MCSSPSTKPADSGDNELSIYPDHAGCVLLRDIPLNARPPNRAYHRMPTSAPTARKHLSRSRQGAYRDGFPLFRPETPSSSPVGSRLFHIRTGGQQCEKPSLRTIRVPPRYWSPSLPARNRIYPVPMLHRRNGQLRTDAPDHPAVPQITSSRSSIFTVIGHDHAISGLSCSSGFARYDPRKGGM